MNIICKGCTFYLNFSNGESIPLFNAMDCISNCSRIPFHQLSEDGSTSYLLRERLKMETDMLSAENNRSQHSVLWAVALLLIFPELIKKYRPYQVLQVGPFSLLTQYLTQLLSQVHPRARLYCISDETFCPDHPITVPIHAEYRTFPFPQNRFDIVLVDNIPSDVLQDIFPNLVSSITANGFFIYLPPIGENSSWMQDAFCSIGESGNYIMYNHVSLDQKTSLLRDTAYGLLQSRKNVIRRALSEMEHGLHHLFSLDSSDAKTVSSLLDRLISEIAQVENMICEIYEDLISTDIKYKINLFKEAVIQWRLEKNPQNLPEKVETVRFRHQQLLTELAMDFYFEDR